ncbi:MAG: nitroreductase [archaeon]|nr:nitroreductase [archaeon]
MEFSKPITEIIRERTSWRTYVPEPLKDDVLKSLKELIAEEIKTPFSQYADKYKLQLIEMKGLDPNEKHKLGTYGFIKGPQHFLVGLINKVKKKGDESTVNIEYNREDFGYLFEKIILKLTDMGLGTCWMGGTFDYAGFSEQINRRKDEVIAALTPIGYINKRRAKEKVIRTFARAKKRIPWETIFFEGNFDSPLEKVKAGNYSNLLEMVRLGPSASNKQPWRVVKEIGKNIFHFYVLRTNDKLGSNYNKFRRLDIGIAVCHFDLSAKEADLKGKWEFKKPEDLKPIDLAYTITWNGS